eukprot:CFRG0369T1
MDFLDHATVWLKNGLTVGLPRYLKNCPIPSTAKGWFDLTSEQWVVLMPLISFGLAMTVIIISSLFDGSGKWKDEAIRLQKELRATEGQVNHLISLDKAKVVNTETIEDTEQKVMCRCWKSKKFPYCDGTHTKHNEQTGDNVGPLIVKGSKKE